MSRKRLLLNLSKSEKEELERIILRSRNDPRMARRCSMILLTEKGLPLQGIAELLGVSKTTVNTWRQIFKKRRLSGIVQRKPVGRPRGALGKSTSKSSRAGDGKMVALCATEPSLP
jgi:DNA-binding CsgD family transcriptional regulator